MKHTIKLTTVELFAGIGGFRLASEKFGVKTVWANDNDKDACNVYRSRFGVNELETGDINNLISSVPKHDILTAGFPCQPFSSAGKKQGIQDPRGTLFESIVKIIRKNSPKYFILENVKRLIEMDSGKHFATILSALSDLDYIIEWRVVNAMNLGLPQNRARIVIIGKLKNGDTPGKMTKLLAKDEVSQMNISPNLFGNQIWRPIIEHGSSFPHWGLAYNGKFIGFDVKGFSEAKPQKLLKDIIEKNVGSEFVYNEGMDDRIKNSIEVNRLINGTSVLYNQRGGARMGYTVFGVDGIAPTLTSSTSRHYERYKTGEGFRRLTNVEYARIQGFPDNHCSPLSVYKQYKLYGNAIPPVIAEWAIKKLLFSKGEELL